MSKRPEAEKMKSENPEWTVQDFAGAVSYDALPDSLRDKLHRRGPQKAPTKERITIRLSRDVVERFRATGEGWQSRVDAALKAWLRDHRG